MTFSSTPWPNHPASDRIRKTRHLYAWVTNSLAMLVILSCVLSLSIRQFRTIAQLQVRSAPGLTTESVEQRVLDSIKAASSDEALKETIQGVHQHVGTAPKIPVEAIDFDKLRQKLRFAIVPSRSPDTCQVLIEYVGTATRMERELVNGFAARVHQGIDWSAANSSAQPSAEQIAANRQTVQRLLNAVQQISQVTTEIAPDLEAHQFGMLVPDTLEKLTAAELQWLQREITAQYGPESSELALFREKFSEQLSSQDPLLADEAASPFRLSSTTREDEAGPRPLGEIRERLMTLPVQDLQRELQQLESNWTTPLVSGSEKQSLIPARVFSSTRARHEPIGLIADRSILIGLLLTSVVVGWVISRRINPNLFDSGVRPGSSLEKELNLPTVATVRRLVAPATPAPEIQEKILKASEFVLMLTVLLLVTLSLTNSEIRQAILHNPLHALTSVLWSLFH